MKAGLKFRGVFFTLDAIILAIVVCGALGGLLSTAVSRETMPLKRELEMRAYELAHLLIKAKTDDTGRYFPLSKVYQWLIDSINKGNYRAGTYYQAVERIIRDYSQTYQGLQGYVLVHYINMPVQGQNPVFVGGWSFGGGKTDWQDRYPDYAGLKQVAKVVCPVGGLRALEGGRASLRYYYMEIVVGVP